MADELNDFESELDGGDEIAEDIEVQAIPEAPVDIEEITDEDIAAAKAKRERGRGRHGRHGGKAVQAESTFDVAAEAANRKKSRKKGEDLPEYMRKSRRMRRVLIAVVALLIALLAVGAFFVMNMFMTVQNTATQQAQITSQEIDVNQDSGEARESNTSTAKRTTVPNLVELFGMTQEEAVEHLQHGAQISSSREVTEAGNPIHTETRVALTAEPADSRTGTPTVYLGLDTEGHVIQAGYSASTSALGYGSFSFKDAVSNVGVVEATLNEAGLAVPEHTAQLPEDKTAYSSYASDGVTLTNESCGFEGQQEQGGALYHWSAVLSYDYSMANATGNLADTMRTIYVYIATF